MGRISDELRTNGDAVMLASTLGGDDPLHDLSDEEKDVWERQAFEEARDLGRAGRHKERRRKLARANEISRDKSKKSHQV